MEFKDISTEKYRCYVFTSNNTVEIKNPIKINTSANGHRIIDKKGISHYIPIGWVHLYWKSKKGTNKFLF